MIEYVNGCKGCGMSPCYECKDVVYICDECDKEKSVLYDLAGMQLCKSCYRDSIKIGIKKFTKGDCIACGSTETVYSLKGDTDKYCSCCLMDYINENMIPVREE